MDHSWRGQSGAGRCWDLERVIEATSYTQDNGKELGPATSCWSLQDPKFHDRCCDPGGHTRPARRFARSRASTVDTMSQPYSGSASPTGRASTSRRDRVLGSGNSSECSIRVLLRFSGNVIVRTCAYMHVRNNAHASRVRGHMGCAGGAEGGSPTSFTSFSLDVGLCPNGDARSDCLDRLAVLPVIPDREIRPGASGRSGCGRAGHLGSSERGPVPVSRLKV
jgi:hypothetical protein